MDPISLSTAIIPLVTLASSCIVQCYRYGCAVQSAPREAKKLAEELTSLSGVLIGVQGIVQDDNAQGLLSDGSLENLLGECKVALVEAFDQIEQTSGNEDGASRRLNLVKRALWPLRRQETLELIDTVERMKTKLTLVLTTVSTQLILRQQSLINDTASQIQHLAVQLQLESSKSKRERVLDWLTQHNPDTAHQRAVRAYCNDTCSWILEESSFQKWLGSSHQCAVWLNGPPGFGKTVMTSFVVQHLLCAPVPSPGNVVYHYFDANDTNSLSLRTFLASIVRQYCTWMPTLPSRIVDEFDSQQARYGTPRPLDIDNLEDVLDDLLSELPPTFIVIDGIDESSEQQDICGLLNLLADSELVKIFVSSRPEAAIRRHLTSFAEIQMPQAALESDIGKYVTTRMKLEPRLSRLSNQLKKHIQTTIQEKSHGMFRWAQCQLDDISKLRTDRSIRQALTVLPQNLGDLYSLMLSRIPQADVGLAKRALTFLTHSPALLSVDAVAEAAVLEPEQSSISADDRLGDTSDILDICGSLVALDPKLREIRLAHQSVRECLERLQVDQSAFAMPQLTSHRDMAITCLTYLLLDNFSSGMQTSKNDLRLFLRSFPLFSYAAEHFCYHIKASKHEKELQPLILRLFSKKSNPKFMLWLQVVCWESSLGRFEIPGSGDIQPQPLYYASSYGLLETVRSLVRSGAEMDIKAGRFGGTALHAAYWRGHSDIVRFLLESGVNPDIVDLNGVKASELAYLHDDSTFFHLAIDYTKRNTAAGIPDPLRSAVSQVYLQQKKPSAPGEMYSQRSSNRFGVAGSRQYWKSHAVKKPQSGAEDQVFELG